MRKPSVDLRVLAAGIVTHDQIRIELSWRLLVDLIKEVEAVRDTAPPPDENALVDPLLRVAQSRGHG